MAGFNIAWKITKHDFLVQLFVSCFISCKLSHFRVHWKRYTVNIWTFSGLKHFTGQLILKVKSVRYMLCVFDITIKTASFSSESMLIPVE